MVFNIGGQMKKILLICFCFLIFSNLYAAQNKYRLRGFLEGDTTNYWMHQKRDSWEAVREINYPAGTITLSYQIGYSSSTADDFWSVITSTDNWEDAANINYY
jgi:hypothetical protein